ncbi:SDR family NAD(P)-dependent oxidoreductase [Sphingopyxis sp. GW247-27LB]|uniref:SDR family NAD(P)-dependent oxidoreductase n=1 Tax=Sphingopyxis sp. GW247-27LB TaxID=2012632 RepID=UPI000BA7E499|nr:SDR family NAD(P)-dependent oxidoreductase [Sphingopyxis sp. GW247-27LB]PAL20347.1 3-oxoacyl-ACP reductase [Sphingopyxis sp. GW247-27LB]
MAGRLAGKAAIVVGAGQQPGDTIGNGRAIALTFAREGAEVLCVDRVAERAEETAAMIGEAGGQGFAHAADITRIADIEAIVTAALDRWSRIDILVNNVGVGSPGDGPAHRASDEAFERVFDINFTGARRLTRAVLAPMRAAEAGVIINISSLAAIAGANMIAYEISKAALNRLTTATAQGSASKGVRCNAILPGLMDTPMAIHGTAARDGRSLDEQRAARGAMVPLKGGMGDARDTANAALFLASDEARFVTGALLPVDGGASVRVG